MQLLAGESLQQKGDRTKGWGSQLHPQAWKRSWLGFRFPSKSEANAPERQPYPLTEDGEMPA